MLQKIIVCLIAGAGAGFGTGLAGMSAAAVIAPMLVTFLQVKPYEAVGIALASDVLASAASAHTYKKNKNIDVKNGLVMLVSVLIFTLVGSYLASFSSAGNHGWFLHVHDAADGLEIYFPARHGSQGKQQKQE